MQNASPAAEVSIVLVCTHQCVFCEKTAQVGIPIGPRATAWEEKTLRCATCKGYPPMALVGIREEMPKRIQPAHIVPPFGKPS